MTAANQYASDAGPWPWVWLAVSATIGLLSLRGGLRYRKKIGWIPWVHWSGIITGIAIFVASTWAIFAN